MPVTVDAQQAKIRRIGPLLTVDVERTQAQLREELRGLGYVEGQNVRIEFDRCPRDRPMGFRVMEMGHDHYLRAYRRAIAHYKPRFTPGGAEVMRRRIVSVPGRLTPPTHDELVRVRFLKDEGAAPKCLVKALVKAAKFSYPTSSPTSPTACVPASSNCRASSRRLALT